MKLATVACAEDTQYLVWTGILAKSSYVQHRQVSKAAQTGVKGSIDRCQREHREVSKTA